MKPGGKVISRIVLALAILAILLPSAPASAAFYLHGTGPNANPPVLFLDNTAPAASTAKYRDSAGVNFSGGNPWKEIGTWTVSATGTLTSLADLHVWLGLKNSDDIGTRFDLRAEVYRNGQSFVTSGNTYCIQGITRNLNQALEVIGSFGSFSPVDFSWADTLSLKILTRVGTDGAGAFCGGHSNAVGLRLYFDAVSRPARFEASFSENLPPVADAGLDQQVRAGDLVTLDGRNSYDPDGDLITYHWEISQAPPGSAVLLLNPASVMPTFFPDIPGAYTVVLTVNDGQADGSPDNVVVIAAEPNAPPTAYAGPDQSVVTGSQVFLDGTGSFDPNGDPLTFLWQFLSIPADSHAVLDYITTPAPSFLADVNGQYVVELTVHDEESSSLPDSVVITAETPNAPPVANAGDDQTVSRTALIHLDGTQSTDPDNDPLAFTWTIVSKPQGSASLLDDAFSLTPTILADAEGDFVFRLVVNDGQVDSAPDTVVVTVVNDPPVAAAGPDQSVQRNTVLTLDGSGSHDPNGDPLTYLWSIVSSPAGSTAVIGNPTAMNPLFTPDLTGSYTIWLVVNDGQVNSAADTVGITATIPMVNVPDVTGQPQASAEAAIVAAGLAVGAVTTASSATVPAGVVISQNPTGGSSAPEGSPVALVVSSGPPMVTVPSVVGLPQAGAQAAITTAGLVTGTVTTAISSTVLAGNVISQTPAGGSSVLLGSPVDLVVSSGPPLVTVPDVVGKPQGNAQTILTNAGFVVGTVTTAHSDTVIPGDVVSQNPAGGTSSPQGSSVDLVISLGPAPVPIPPDPSTVAPPVDPTVATSMLSASEFLYTGPNPIQTGVAPGTIELKRAAIVRGQVMTRDDTPLPGVIVTIQNHPEFGQTVTRDDGRFDLVVNGGGLLIVNYQKGGYLPAQRQVNVPLQDHSILPDVVLIPYDSQVTFVDLNLQAPIQVAQGSVVTDTDGTRRTTILFPQGTQATRMLPDGSTRPLTSLSVRATEFTVGANGPKAMPAELPPTSAYTYCVDISADEAIAIGATDILFSQPVVHYVENFLSFPVGSAVPVGYYDKKKGVWIPSANGKVIKLISVAGGMANLDTNGDNLADTTAVLSALGITSAERVQLAALYAPGTAVWRTQLTHFSPWDMNWPIGPPSDALVPRMSPMAKDTDESCIRTGSIIECQNQVLGESVPIAGTLFTSNYRSSNVSGRKSDYTLRIPLSGSTLPQSLLRIDLEVHIAGKTYASQYSAVPNQIATVTWDGRDAYGRIPQGRQQATVRIGYVYRAVYRTAASNQQSFGLIGGAPVTGSVARMEITLWQEWQERVGPWDAKPQGLGAWSLNAHHVYDPLDRMLYEGSGTKRRGDDVKRVVTTIAGTQWGFSGDGGEATFAKMAYPYGISFGPDGALYIADTTNHRIRKVDRDGVMSTVAGTGTAGFSGDGGLATQAKLNNPYRVAVAPDGTIYIADQANQRIRRVDPNGVITTFAGTGQIGISGDGGPAIQATFYHPKDVKVGPDGSVYIADSHNHRIRRVGANGIITTVAGIGGPNYGYGFSGDGGPATQASLYMPHGVALDPNGILYIADEYNNRIRRVGLDGIISTVAGTGQIGSLGDGGPATQAQFHWPFALAVGRDGSLFIADTANSRIRRIGSDGIITTIAGTGQAGLSGDKGPATTAMINWPYDILLGPEGSIYVGDTLNHRIRKIGPPFTGISDSEIAIAFEDGNELFIFNGNGKHLRTVNTLTGAILYQFEYDASGLLSRIVDGDNSITTIERDPASGSPTAIVAPGGQHTALSLNPNGYLDTIADPAGNTHIFGYTPDGLMTSYIDPNGYSRAFVYDSLGRLERDEDPEGGFLSLSRTETGSGFFVTTTTALGRATRYEVQKSTTGAEQRINTFPTGARSFLVIGADGKRTTTLPDGTVTELTEGPDPRFGMESPVPVKTTLRTPAGLMSMTTGSLSATLSNPSDPLSLTSRTETVVFNNKTWTNSFSQSAKRFTLTSPAGRQTLSTIDNQGRVLSVNVNPAVDNVTFAYDTQGRLAQTGQGGKNWTFGYDGLNRLTSVTDPSDNVVRYGYDAADRVARVILPSGRTYGFGYDNNGNRTSITMPSGVVHSLGYNKVNLDNTYIPPGNPAYATEYNVDRDWIRTTLPSGRAIDGGYDNGGRLLSVVYPEAGVDLTYNDNTDRVSTLTRVSATDTQAIAFSYDGFLTTRVAFSGVATGEYRYAFDNNFRVTGIALDNVWTTLGRDNDGLVTHYGPFTITRNGPAGAPSNLTDNTLGVDYAYDSFGRLESRTHTVAGQPVYQLTLAYDDVGRISTKTETVSGVPSTYDYTYDLDGQLETVRRDEDLVEQYGYDNNANRTSTISTTAIYDDQDRLIQQGGVSYTFDDDGYLTTRGSDTFMHSARGELLSATVGGQTVTYHYDGIGRRIGRTDAAGTTQYLYGNPGNPFQVTASRDAAGILTTYFYDVAGNLYALERAGQRFYVASDQLGTPKAVTDSTGAIVKTVEYDAWGVEISDSNPSFDLPIGFAGGIPESATGMVRFGWRDYEAGTGRWSARDPIFFNGGLNLYQYASNNPVNWVDPEGTLPPVIWGAIVSGGALAIWAINWWYEATHPPKDACKLKNDKPGDKVPGSPGVPRNFPPYQYQPAPQPRPPAAAGR